MLPSLHCFALLSGTLTQDDARHEQDNHVPQCVCIQTQEELEEVDDPFLGWATCQASSHGIQVINVTRAQREAMPVTYMVTLIFFPSI